MAINTHRRNIQFSMIVGDRFSSSFEVIDNNGDSIDLTPELGNYTLSGKIKRDHLHDDQHAESANLTLAWRIENAKTYVDIELNNTSAYRAIGPVVFWVNAVENNSLLIKQLASGTIYVEPGV